MGIPVFQPYKDENQTYKKDGFFLKAFPLEHDGVQNRGVFIMTPSGEKIVYATDFEFVGHRFTKLAINHFILECNHMDDIARDDNNGKFSHVLRGHSSVSVVKEFLRVNKTDSLKNVILCHLSADNAQPDVMLNEIQDIVGSEVKCYIARKGMSVEL